MGAKGNTSDYAILIGLGLLVAVCLVGILVWGSLSEASNLPGVRTTHSTNVDGAMVASLLSERFGTKLSTSESPLLKENLSKVDVLWVVDPLIPLNAPEVAGIEEWVNAGGVLVSTGIPGRLFGGHHDHYYGGAVSARNRVNRPATAGLADPIPESARDLPLARGVDQLEWLTNGTVHLEEEDDDDAGAFRPLLRDSTGVRVAGRAFGQGTVILLADSSFLANGMIGKQDNAILAMNLVGYSLSRASGENVVYDEYHLGFGHYESGMDALSRMMVTTRPGWAVLSLTVAGVLFLLYKGRQFGTRREPGRVRRRSKMEFVQAVGASFRSAGAHRLTWNLIFGAWKREASRELGLPVCVPVGEIGARLARRAGRPVEDYQACLTACERAAQQGRLSSRKVTELVGDLARMEREALNGTPGRKQNS